MLIVEDEAAVRKVLTRVLPQQGYEVLESESFDTALEAYRSRRDDTEGGTLGKAEPAPGIVMVQKPLVFDQLLRVVRTALDEGREGWEGREGRE